MTDVLAIVVNYRDPGGTAACAASFMDLLGQGEAWSGTGLSVPRRLMSRQAIRLAARELLADRRFTERARELAAWSEENDGAETAADLVEKAALQKLRGRDSNPQPLG